jgi:hypothetical protein
MPITLTQSFPKLSSVKMTDEALMREIGLQAIRAIQARTRQGRDSSGRAFAPYSPGYAKAKAKAVGGSMTPNLTLSGDMLNALQIVEVTPTSVTLGWMR